MADQLSDQMPDKKTLGILRMAAKRLATVDSMAKLDVIRDLLGRNNIDQVDLVNWERGIWDLLIFAIKTRLAEFGVECSGDDVLSAKPSNDDTIFSMQARALRLNLGRISPEEVKQMQLELEEDAKTNTDNLTDIERKELDLLMAAIQARIFTVN